jgi:hypothetical protein
MSHQPADFEERFVANLSSHVEGQRLDRDPQEVAAWAMSSAPHGKGRSIRPRLWLISSVAAGLVLVLAASQLVPWRAPDEGQGSAAARVTVQGVVYHVGGGRTFTVDRKRLEWHGSARGPYVSHGLLRADVFRLPDIDPAAVLVAFPTAKWREDLGPPGPYALLYGPGEPYPALCAYVLLGHPGSPVECTEETSSGT